MRHLEVVFPGKPVGDQSVKFGQRRVLAYREVVDVEVTMDDCARWRSMLVSVPGSGVWRLEVDPWRPPLMFGIDTWNAIRRHCDELSDSG